MAKKKNPMLKTIKSINSDSYALADNVLSIADSFIDTGSYALNAIISGSLYGGIGVGKVTGFAGPSRCGKSLIAANTVANAQKLGYHPVVWDTEGAWESTMTNLGIDSEDCHILPVGSVEETKSQIMKLLEDIKNSESNDKYIFVLDSLGGLSSSKEIKDSMEGSTAVDMGTRARIIKSMMRQITYKCNSAKVPLIYTNHIYANPAGLPSVVKNESGGSGPKYMATTQVQLGLRNDKIVEKAINPSVNSDDDDDSLPEVTGISAKIKGSTITAITTKNRLAPEFLYTELYINFITGLDRYAGLFEMCRSFGVITGSRTYALADGTKLGYKKDILPNTEQWENLIMPILEKTLQAQIKRLDKTPAKPSK